MQYIETRFENTIMKEIRDNDNKLIGYDISPDEGYVLHNSKLDNHNYDIETKEQKELLTKGYSRSSCSIESNYDFDTNPYEIYAIKEDAVGDDGVIY